MNKTAFIVHGRRSIAQRFKRTFQKNSRSIEGEYAVFITSERGHAKSLATELAHDGYTHVIAVGGDGTLHEVVNGVIISDNPNCVVGLLPAGTANDYAKNFTLEKKLAPLIHNLNANTSTKVNLGKITLSNNTAEYFINIADMGLGVDVVKRVNRSKKLLGSNLTFTKAILESFFHFKNQEVNVKTSDWSWEGRINSLIVANGKYFGSGMCIAPEADTQGDNFAVVIVGDVSMRDYLNHIGKIKRGQKIDHPEIHYHQAHFLEINSAHGIEADGEYLGNNPTSIRLIRRKLNFLVDQPL